MIEKEYKKYIKKELWGEFKKHCEVNSLDFYGCGCVLTAHLVMKDLMGHETDDEVKQDKVTPKEAWESAMEQTPYHSGFSAGCTAQTIIHFSPRGEEFQKWWNKKCGGTGEENGVINPAILTIDTHKKEAEEKC